MDAQPFIDLAHFGQVTRYSHIAAYSLFVYDWLLSLSQESKYLRGSRISRGKITYLFCRYWPLLTYPIIMWVQVSDHNRTLCANIFKVPMFLTILNLLSAAGILVVRLYAFTNRNNAIAIFLIACMITVAIYQAFVAAVKSALIPIGNGCFPVDTGKEKHLSGYFLASLLLDCTITITFVIYTIVRISVAYKDMSTVTRVFIREGAAYFMAISAVNIINGGFNFQPNLPMQTVAVPFSLLLANILACRLVLNLHSAVVEKDDGLQPLSLSSSGRNPSADAEAGETLSLVDMGNMKHKPNRIEHAVQYPVGALMHASHVAR